MKKKKTAASEFSRCYSITKEKILSGDYDGAQKYARNLEKIWHKSGNYVHKKAYNGAKKALNKIKYNKNDIILQKIGPIIRDEIFYAVVSPSLYATFAEPFFEKYNLIDLDNILDTNLPHNIPCVYFGCYKERDFNKIKNNSSDFKIVVYGGTDATRSRNLKEVSKIKNLKHIAISNYIVDDLNRLKIPHKKVGITPIDHSKYKFEVEPLGSSVYIYNGSEANAARYGKKMYKEVMRNFPDLEFKICGHGDYSRDELINIYKNSFIGLRLLNHDGLSNTVIEMALMGRRVVHNGGLPSSISYDSAEDVCRIIEEERKKIGTKNKEVRDKTLLYLNNSRNWLKKSFWK